MRETGNILRIIRARHAPNWAAMGGAFCYARCVNDTDPAVIARARAIARVVLDTAHENSLYRAATAYVRDPPQMRIAHVATAVRRLDAVAPALALLSNGHDPCDSLRRALKNRPLTSIAPPPPKAAART